MSTEFDMFDEISKSMHPIYGFNSGKLEYRGTSFCMNYSGKEYLVTASHVLAGQDFSENLICFDGLLQTIPSGISVSFRHANVDISVAYLTRRVCSKSLSFKSIDSFKNCESRYALMGYPMTRFAANSRKSKYEIRIALSSPNAEYNKMLPDAKVHFACPFHRKNAIFANGMKGIFAEPHGMSGGLAVFFIGSAICLENLGLAGVITDLCNAKLPYIRCTRSEIIVEAIELIEAKISKT